MLVADAATLGQCCSSSAWAAQVAASGPYRTLEDLIAAARQVWWHQTPVTGWLEAFAAHPKIGDLESLKAKYGAFADMSKGEQAAAAGAPEATLQELAGWNARYKRKFGHIFIICASGKSAEEMLAAIKDRFTSDPAAELQTAAIEQMKITELRLAKLFGTQQAGSSGGSSSEQADRRAGQILAQVLGRAGPAAQPGSRSPITTHVLDTCLGRPAAGVRITLRRLAPGSAGAWEVVASSQTNQDGRIGDLLPATGHVPAGSYRITFDTSEYMARCKAAHPTFFPDHPFYPSVSVDFQVQPHQTREHFHVPLTWNPFGYSTYRGS